MRNFKRTSNLLKGLPCTLALLAMLVAGCSKELEEKKPDDFDRDVHPISEFEGSAFVETVDEGVQTLSVQSDVASGIYALNELALRPVKFVGGDERLAALFNGLKLESTKAGEKFKFNFKLTKGQLIAYMETDGHNLSTSNKELIVNYKDRPSVAIFHYDVNDYGIVRNRPNDLNEETRFIEFKSTRRAEATHIKMNVVPQNRVLNGLRGHYDEDIYLKDRLEARNWNLTDVAKLFHIQTANLTSASATVNDKKAKMIDETLYVMAKTTLSELSTMEKLALSKGDPRYTTCSGARPSQAESIDPDLCVYKPIYSGAAKKVRLKLKKDDEGETLGTVDLEEVSGTSKANFAMIDTNTLFTKFEYDDRITQIENRYIYDFKDLQNKVWQADQLKAYLKVKKDLGSGVRKTVVFDKNVWIQAPMKRSDLTEIEIAAIGKDQRFAKCDAEIASKVEGISERECVLKPIFSLPAAPMALSYKFYDGKEEPTIKLEPIIGEEQADFLVVVTTLDLFDYTYARSYRDILFDKEKLNDKVLKGRKLKAIFPTATFADDSKLYKLKVLDSNVWILEAANKDRLEVLERAMAGNDPRFEKCDGELSAGSGIALNDCFAKPIARISAAHAIVEFEDADNVDLPDLKVHSGVDRRISTHLLITEKPRISKFELDERFKESDEMAQVREINNKIISGSQAAKLLGIQEVSSQKILKTRLVHENLYLLAPTKKSDLHIIEQEAIDRDPRYEVCSMDIAEQAQIDLADCIMRPIFSRNVSFVALFFERDIDSDIPRVRYDFNVNSDLAEIIYFKKSSEARKFDFMRNLNVADRIHLSKEKDFDLDSEYLYITMTHGTPREVLQADPFYQGNEKLVHLRFTKQGLEVYEKDRDDRFRDNALNEKPVLLIPGVYEDYKCQEDANGNCLAGIQSDNDLTWDQKKLFVPTFEALQVKEINTLDVFTVEADPCLIPNGTALASYEVKKGVINIELEKTYKMSKSWRCIAELYFADTDAYTGFSNGGFKVRFNYSIVRLKDLASADYEKVEYPISDHDEFGFFKNYERKLGDSFDPSRTNQSYLLNRWNPKKKVITYHLSDTYNEPEQKLIKEATYKVFDGINIALKKANAGIQLKLEEPSGKLAGDLRHNVLQLITDPLSNGLLGYAPTVTNPYTGEILQGHVNMYSGVIRTMSRRVWEGMVDLTETEKKQADADQTIAVDAPSDEAPGAITNEELQKAIRAQHAPRASRVSPNLLAKFKRGSADSRADIGKYQDRAYKAMDARLKEVRQESVKDDASKIEKHLKFIENRLARWSESNAYATEFFRIAHTAKTLYPGIKEIKGVVNADGTLKRWNQLSKDQQARAMDIMVPFVYISTLVHEMGHSLGLRHNFNGSFDAANFYTEAEAQALGLRAAPAYSSIMDYSASELNNLLAMGKYDIAALRFGYAREVELQNGEFVKVPSTLEDLEASGTLPAPKKDYGFCTDENAGLSATCNRFDEGSTLVEVAQAKIEDYKLNYRYRNFRDDRDEFRAEGLVSYTIARMREFDRIRNIFEEWEFFEGIFGPLTMIQGCSPDQVKQFPICKQINDRRDAAKMVGNFFVDILKTPDHYCAVLDQKTNKVEKVKLVDLYEEVRFDHVDGPTSCFDKMITDKVSADEKQVVAEVGKFLNGFRDNNPNFPYSNDRFARGVWIDKMMAMKALYQRESGKPTTETNHLALIDHPEIAPQVENILEHILNGNELSNPIPFTGPTGKVVPVNMLTYSIKADELIDGPSDSIDVIKDFFGLPETGKEALAKALLGTAKKWGLVGDIETRNIARRAVNHFTIRKSDIADNINLDQFASMRIGEINYSAGDENIIARDMVQTTLIAQNYSEELHEAMTKVYMARINPTVVGQPTPLKLFALRSNETDWQEFMMAVTGGALASQDAFTELSKEIGLSKAFKILEVAPSSEEELNQALTLRQMSTTAPDDATAIEKELYTLGIGTMERFLLNVKPENIQATTNNLKYLPRHVKEIDSN